MPQGFPFGDKIPTEMITSKQRVNVEAHWYGNSTTPAHKKALLDKYISVCYPNQYVRAHDVSVLTWNIGQRALSCTTNGAAYASITGPGANTLAASVMLTVLEVRSPRYRFSPSLRGSGRVTPICSAADERERYRVPPSFLVEVALRQRVCVGSLSACWEIHEMHGHLRARNTFNPRSPPRLGQVV